VSPQPSTDQTVALPSGQNASSGSPMRRLFVGF
jgi:hypothetical protein